MTDKQSADEWLAQRIYFLISAANVQPTEAELEAFAEEFHKRKLAEQPSFESRCAEVLRGVVMKYWPKNGRATPDELDELYRKIGVKMCSVMKQLESEASDER